MQDKDVLIISILTFITVLAWIFFDAYHVYKTSTIPEDLKVQLEPLNLNISLSEIEALRNRPEFFPIAVPTATTPANLENLPTPETTSSAIIP